MSDVELYYSSCGEVFNADSPDDLCLDDGDTYYRGERQDIEPRKLIGDWCAAGVIEQMGEQLYDIVGEFAESGLQISEQAQDQLQKMIEDWADKNATVSCYRVANVVELQYKSDAEKKD